MSERDTAIFLPGLGCDERLWQHQLSHLGDVVEPRFAGIADAGEMASIAGAVLAAAPPVFTLVALSMGGYVAFEIMRRAPERVRRLALLDTKADLDPPEAAAGRLEAVAEIEAGHLAEHIESRLPVLLGPVSVGDPTVRETVRAMALTVGDKRYVKQLQAIMGRPDSTPELGEITCPTLVLCGRDDALTPVDKQRAMAGAMARARFAVIEEAGHLSAIEQPVAVTAVLRYWLSGDG